MREAREAPAFPGSPNNLQNRFHPNRFLPLENKVHSHNSAAMSQLRPEDLRALEQTRQRLYQLTQSIGSLKQDVQRTTPMPAW